MENINVDAAGAVLQYIEYIFPVSVKISFREPPVTISRTIFTGLKKGCSRERASCVMSNFVKNLW